MHYAYALSYADPSMIPVGMNCMYYTFHIQGSVVLSTTRYYHSLFHSPKLANHA